MYAVSSGIAQSSCYFNVTLWDLYVRLISLLPLSPQIFPSGLYFTKILPNTTCTTYYLNGRKRQIHKLCTLKSYFFYFEALHIK